MTGARERGRSLVTGLLVLVLLTGIALICYPLVSDAWNRSVQTRAVATYQEQVETVAPAQLESLRAEAQAYNETLVGLSNSRFILTETEQAEYETLLQVGSSEVIGYLEIPAIDVSLPIYHGTGEAALMAGAGHFAGSSLPIGGESTHAVLTGHRGLPSAKLFTDLDDLVEGDLFTITVLGETLAYEVISIKVVEPDDLSDLQIVEGKDLVTLVTCTPYGVNTHRLLVTGERTELPEDADLTVAPWWNQLAWLGALAALAIVTLGAAVWRNRQRQRNQYGIQHAQRKQHGEQDGRQGQPDKPNAPDGPGVPAEVPPGTTQDRRDPTGGIQPDKQENTNSGGKKMNEGNYYNIE